MCSSEEHQPVNWWLVSRTQQVDQRIICFKHLVFLQRMLALQLYFSENTNQWVRSDNLYCKVFSKNVYYGPHFGMKNMFSTVAIITTDTTLWYISYCFTSKYCNNNTKSASDCMCTSLVFFFSFLRTLQISELWKCNY